METRAPCVQSELRNGPCTGVPWRSCSLPVTSAMIHLVAFLDPHVIRADPPFSLISVKSANRFSLLSDHEFKSDRKSSPDNSVPAASTSIFLAAAACANGSRRRRQADQCSASPGHIICKTNAMVRNANPVSSTLCPNRAMIETIRDPPSGVSTKSIDSMRGGGTIAIAPYSAMTNALCRCDIWWDCGMAHIWERPRSESIESVRGARNELLYWVVQCDRFYAAIAIFDRRVERIYWAYSAN
jgi:hypothetical protein